MVALDKHRRMFKTTVAYEGLQYGLHIVFSCHINGCLRIAIYCADYASVVLDQIDSIHLPACGGITHTTRGVRLPGQLGVNSECIVPSRTLNSETEEDFESL